MKILLYSQLVNNLYDLNMDNYDLIITFNFKLKYFKYKFSFQKFLTKCKSKKKIIEILKELGFSAISSNKFEFCWLDKESEFKLKLMLNEKGFVVFNQELSVDNLYN